MKLDPGIHIAMHSVLSLKPGVTLIEETDIIVPRLVVIKEIYILLVESQLLNGIGSG